MTQVRLSVNRTLEMCLSEGGGLKLGMNVQAGRSTGSKDLVDAHKLTQPRPTFPAALLLPVPSCMMHLPAFMEASWMHELVYRSYRWDDSPKVPLSRSNGLASRK